MKSIFLTAYLLLFSVAASAQVIITPPQPEGPFDYLSVVDNQIFFGGKVDAQSGRGHRMHYRIFSLTDSLAPPREIDIEDPFPGSNELHYLRSAVAFEDYCYEIYYVKGEGRQHHNVIRRNLHTMETEGSILDLDTDAYIELMADKTGVQIIGKPSGKGLGLFRYSPDLSEGSGVTYEKLDVKDFTIQNSALDQYGNLIINGSYVIKRPMYGNIETAQIVIVNDVNGKSHLIAPTADVAFTFSAVDFSFHNDELTGVFYTKDGEVAGFRIASWDTEGKMLGSSLAGTFSLDAVLTDEVRNAMKADKVKLEKVKVNHLPISGLYVIPAGDNFVLAGQGLFLDNKYLNNYTLIAVVSKEGSILSQHLIPRPLTDLGTATQVAVANGQIKVLAMINSTNVENGRYVPDPTEKKGFQQLFARTIDLATGEDLGFTPVTTVPMKGYTFLELNRRKSEEQLQVYKLWNTRANKNRYLIYNW